MVGTHTARKMGINHWDIKTGPRNLITDVPGVTVGHATVSRGDIRTGVTALLPHPGNIFREKPLAAAHVINGFGKSMGLVQVREMGTIETPIILTNTLSIGRAAEALTARMLAQNPEIGVTTGTVNPMVFECNDGHLNDIRGMHVTADHVEQAIDTAGTDFQQGALGAGTGMCAYGLKGGIGSASRRFAIGDKKFTLGTMVLTNMGKTKDLIIGGRRVGPEIERQLAGEKQVLPGEIPPQGSVIVIIATDLPLSLRQLGRICRRAVTGLALTGSKTDSGSGEIVLAFSTATLVPHFPPGDFISVPQLHDDRINPVFRAAIEAVEEAVLNSMFAAAAVTGIRGNRVHGLAACMPAPKKSD
ncbi:MAG: P1 family peptidase [Desulfobacter sp.]|nr:MAG: P1 family peptidase [Desulfobacter sp.]